MLDMIISRASSTFRVLDLRSRSLWLFFLKNFFIALVLTFINGFQYNFTQMLGIIIFQVRSCLKSMSLWLFLEKLCYVSSAYIDGF